MHNIAPIAPKERLIVKTVQLEPKKPTIQIQQDLVLIEEKPSPPKIENEQQLEQKEIVLEQTKITEELVVTKNEEIAIVEPAPLPKEEIKPAKKEPLPIKLETPPIKKVVKKDPVKKAKPKSVKPETKVAAKKKKEVSNNKSETTIAKKLEPKGPSIAEKKLEEERKVQVAKQMKLLAKAKESIAKIDISRDTLSTTGADTGVNFSNLKSIDHLQIDALPTGIALSSLSDPESSYISELRHRLELMLKLPERGDVKILLTLNRSGNVDNLTIVNSKSEANKLYVEGKLPKATFSNFGTNFTNHDKYTFQITLKNQ